MKKKDKQLWIVGLVVLGGSWWVVRSIGKAAEDAGMAVVEYYEKVIKPDIDRRAAVVGSALDRVNPVSSRNYAYVWVSALVEKLTGAERGQPLGSQVYDWFN